LVLLFLLLAVWWGLASLGVKAKIILSVGVFIVAVASGMLAEKIWVKFHKRPPAG
jgi:hypothetical protein